MTHGDLALTVAERLRAGEPARERIDVAIVGAGPAGLSVAQAALEAGLEFLILERENLAHHWRRYPGDMTLLSTRRETELPGFGLAHAKEFLSRQEAIDYFVAYARHHGLDRFVVPRTSVESLEGEPPEFVVHAKHSLTGEPRVIEARVIVLATGAFAVPKPLGVPGENLPFVARWFGAGSDHVGEDVVVVGGGNSGVEAALDLVNHGAKHVTMLVRSPSLKFYRETGELSDVREGSEAALRALMKDETNAARLTIVYEANVDSIDAGRVRYRVDGAPRDARADFVYALTGYGFDEGLYRRLEVPLGPDGPVLTAERETLRAGVYVAGAGRFIQHFREDGRVIIADALLHHLPARRRVR
ncbi:MAG: NAD(P)-binding domain-containing protein [Thermoplasmatota archaeon]